MSKPSINEIDFEQWVELASSDPEKFEELRQNKISAVINKTSGQRQQRLLGLQWQIDSMRARHKNSSIAACNAISELMWNAFKTLSDVLQAQANNDAPISSSPAQAKIIAFPKMPES